MKLLLRTLLVLLLFAGWARGAEWDPAKTQVVLVSVTRWADPEILDFPKLGRLDGRLERAIVKSGVPSENVVLLKEEAATHDAVRDALGAAAKRTPAGGTVIFYFSGHGHRDGRGSVVLATSDMQSGAERDTRLGLDQLESILQKNARGKRVLLLGDACYSGALGRVLKAPGARG